MLRAAGRFAAPVPLAETLMAGWLLAQAGIAVPGGPLTIAPVHADGHIALTADGTLSGRARRVPFARNAGHIAVLAHRGGETVVALVAAAGSADQPSDEPRRRAARRCVIRRRHRPRPCGRRPSIKTCSSASAPRCACSRWPARSKRSSNSRSSTRSTASQFGRPIAKFQAVQHNLATLAGEVAAASAAADAAAEACARPEIAIGEIAIAKVRGGEAAGTGAAIAHQVHGAMGFTYEHSLHHATRRLWSWREEFGNEAVWAARLGRMVAEHGADELWPFITAGS